MSLIGAVPERRTTRIRRELSSSRAVVMLLVPLAVLTFSLWQFGPWAQRAFTEYQLPRDADIPAAIAAGADGTVWFTLDTSSFVGLVRNGQVRTLSTGVQNVEPLGLAVDRAGAAWYTDTSARSVSRITPDGKVTPFYLSTPVARFGRLAIAPDGAVWFADVSSDSITRIKDGVFTQHPLRAPELAPFGVAVDRQGTVWAALGAANTLLRIGPDGHMVEIDAPSPRAGLSDIAVGPDGSVWMVELRVNRLARYHQGRFTEYPVPRPAAGLTALAVAPNGDVWSTELVHHQLVRLRDGNATEFAIPRNGARPFGIAVDPAGNVWYADLSGRIGMLTSRAAQSTCVAHVRRIDICWPV